MSDAKPRRRRPRRRPGSQPGGQPRGDGGGPLPTPEPLPEGIRLELDPGLPITTRADDIARALREHQVLVVAGETGSGKTTQLPKLCLALGRTSIGHTQPRRIAARSVAERVAEEMGTSLGEVVGYQVRFTRQASARTRLKLMTDGILLAEIGHDPMLRRYDTIIIDEAHERSLNIDFLLGFLKTLLPRRPELKVVVTSATIDTARFAEHFAAADGTPAPVVEVSGRTYPVELRYRPLRAADTTPTTSGPDDPDDPAEDSPDTAVVGEDLDQSEGIVAAVRELWAARDLTAGDVLVFCSGEREIREAAEALGAADLPHTEILPLYSRLSAAEQHRVFARHPGRRVVLATNVAETSLTVPGVRYVVDTGTARISRWSARSKVQRLPVEPVSQASANQRAGRCGRLGPGVCIRLYSEADYQSRPEFTEPEVLRTNLAAVILKMADARLGAITDFPFVEPPPTTQVADGVRLLEELGALDQRHGGDHRRGGEIRLTGLGRRLARLPIDPRLGRMLLAADELGCLGEVLVVVAGMSVQDPRERPSEQREAADAQHRRFWTPTGADPEPATERSSTTPEVAGSDFLAWLHLWRYLRRRRRELSGNAFRRMCREEYLNFVRVREWTDLHGQLREICAELGLTTGPRGGGADETETTPDATLIHTALLSGLLSQVGLLEVTEKKQPKARRPGGRPRAREYLGARGIKFAIAPGSVLTRRPPELVVAGELVETSRLWARTVAAVTPEQLEQVGAHLLKRQYSEPHWSERTASVMAHERITMLGVPVVAQRQVPYARVDPGEARRIFIQAALVEGRWRSQHHFIPRNAAVRAEAEQLEERARRRDIVVDDDAIAAFYDARLPAEVVSGTHFDRWWRDARRTEPGRLDLSLDDLVLDAVAPTEQDFPDHWEVAGLTLAVGYVFDPGSGQDGVTVTIPVEVLNQVRPEPFSWQVPGLRAELATELLRGLPKQLRTRLVPAPDHARRALAWLAEHPPGADEGLTAALSQALRALTGEDVAAGAWHSRPVPDHLRVRFRVTTPSGDRWGRDLAELQRELAVTVSQSLGRASAELLQTGRTDWTFGTVETRVELERGGLRVVGYPTLTEEKGGTVGLLLAESEARRAQLDGRGLRRLVVHQTPDPTRWVVGHLSSTDKLALAAGPYPGVPALLADARYAATSSLVDEAGPDVGRPRDETGFRALCDRVRAEQAERMREVVRTTARVLLAHQEVARLLGSGTVPGWTRTDVEEQVANLVFAGFVGVTDWPRLQQLPRYLDAAAHRLRTAAADPARDARLGEDVTRVEEAYAELVAEQPPGSLPPPVDDVGWQLEELRVGLFAQGLGTRHSVSVKRVLRAVAEARTAVGAR